MVLMVDAKHPIVPQMMKIHESSKVNTLTTAITHSHASDYMLPALRKIVLLHILKYFDIEF